MTQSQEAEKSGLQSIVIGLLRDVRTLVQQEMALARHEVQYEIGKGFKAVLWVGMAIVLAVIGLFVTAATCVLILLEYTELPAWACAAIVSVTLLGGAWTLIASGWRMAKSVHLTPVRTVRTLMDDAKWVAEWMRTRYT